MKCIDTGILKKTMRNHGICVVIPTYNNAGTLHSVITETLRYCSDVIVVNDGSTDATRGILQTIRNIDVVDYPRNEGKGTALKRGFRHAMSRGFRYAITLDSDGQHYPEDIAGFVQAIVEHPEALVVGERDLSGVDINAQSSFANKFSNFWFRVQTGLRLRDTQTGFRAYPLQRLRGLGLLTSRYEAELELLVFSAWHGTPILSIPIGVFYPPQCERVSHFRPVWDFTRISILNTILCVLAVVYGLPMRIYNLFAQRKLFGEFKAFTHSHGIRRDAAVTLGRLCRSLYGALYFAFWSMVVFTPMTFLCFSIGRNTEAKRLRLHSALRWISAHFLRMLPAARVSCEGLDAATFATPAIVVCNHQSLLDLPILMSLHSKLIFLTNDRVWNNPFYGHVIHRAEFLPVSAGLDVILPRLKDLRDRGYSIVIFPEGTRSPDCSILPFHQGAFHLARELRMDILPMVLHGAGHYMPKNDTLFRRGDIVLRILPRATFAGRPAGLTIRAEARACRMMIHEQYRLLASQQETCPYFRSQVLYRYAWRGWDIVARCKEALGQMDNYRRIIEAPHTGIRHVRIIHGGIGVFPLLYALVRKDVEVYAFEECLADYHIAEGTAALPPNLHYRHVVWADDCDFGGCAFDRTILLDGTTPHVI